MPLVSKLLSEDGSLKDHLRKLAEKAFGYGVLPRENHLALLVRYILYLERFKEYALFKSTIEPALHLAYNILASLEEGREPGVPEGGEFLLVWGAEAMRRALHRYRAEL